MYIYKLTIYQLEIAICIMYLQLNNTKINIIPLTLLVTNQGKSTLFFNSVLQVDLVFRFSFELSTF